MKAAPTVLNKPEVHHYLFAVIATLLALLIRLALAPMLLEKAVFMPFFMAVLLSAWYGGLRPGLLATILSTLAVAIFILAPIYQLAVAANEDRLQLFLFFCTASGMCWVCESFHVIRRQLDANQQLLQREILERERAEYTRAHLAAIVESSDDAILSNRLDGTILSWNAGAQRLFGYLPEEIVGQNITQLMPPEQIAEEEMIVSQCTPRDYCKHLETVRITKDGRRIDVSISTSPLQDQQGQVIGTAKIIRDIREQKRAEIALRESEKLYRAIGESIDFGVWVCEPDGKNIYASDSFLKLVGITQEQCSNFGWGEVLHPDDVERTIAAWKKCVTSADTWDIEHRFRGVDGQWHPVLARGVPVKNESGQIQNWVGINLDISHLKQAEQELRDSEQRMRLATEATSVGIWEWNVLTNKIRWDAQMFRIYGISPTPDGIVPYGAWSEAVLPEDLPEQILVLQDTVRSKGKSKREFRIQRANDQQTRIIRSVETVRTNSSGEAEWVVGTNLDITEHKQAVLALNQLNASLEQQVEERTRAASEREEQLRAVLNTAADAIITINERGHIIQANVASEQIFGYSQDELIGQNVNLLMPSPYSEEHDGYLTRYLQTGQARLLGQWRELRGKRKDESIFPLELAISKVGDRGLFTGIIRDVTEQKELQKQVLEISTQEQRRIGQELHDGIGQELTGLTLIAGTLCDLLNTASHNANSNGNGNDQPTWSIASMEMKKLRDTSQRLAHALAQAIKHVQDLSYGIMPVQIEANGLRSALDELAASTDNLPNIRCRFQCPAAVEVVDNTTATHLYRIAQEAVNNALKHGQADTIRIALLQLLESIVLDVSDNGCGFDPNHKSDSTVAKHRRSFGLEIMNYRAGMIGGTLRIDRRAEGGMQVKCVLPRRG